MYYKEQQKRTIYMSKAIITVMKSVGNGKLTNNNKENIVITLLYSDTANGSRK